MKNFRQLQDDLTAVGKKMSSMITHVGPEGKKHRMFADTKPQLPSIPPGDKVKK